MHGTQVNNAKLCPHVPHVVKVGDVLSFGTEVRRGPELFPPCEFRIDYELSPWTSVSLLQLKGPDEMESANNFIYSRGFQFPEDSSDIEDEQDNSEEEEGCPDSQEDDMTPVESPVRKPSTLIDAIDLTRDDSDPVEVSTGPQGLSAEEVDADKHAMRHPPEEDIQSTGRLENPIVLEDFDSDEDEDDFEVENEEPDYDESERGSEEDSDKENNEETDESHDEAGDASEHDWETSEILDTESHPEASQVSDAAPTPGRMFHDNRDIPVSNIRTTAGGPNDDAHHAEINFYNKTKDNVDWNDSLSDEDDDDMSQDEDIIERVESGVENSNHSVADAIPTLGSHVQPTGKHSGPSLISQGLASIRQPSPSDAAMAKSMNQNFGNPPLVDDMNSTQTINPVQIHNLPGHKWNQFIAQTLGEKSGKHDFFQAREINRARVNDDENRHTEYNFMGEGIARTKFNLLGHPYNPRPPVPAPIQNTGPQQTHYFQRMQPFAQQQIPPANAFNQPRTFQQQIALKQQAMEQQMAQARAQAQQQMAQAQIQAQRAAQHLMVEQNIFKQGSPFASVPQHSAPTSLGQQPSVEAKAQVSTSVPRAPSPVLDMTSAARFNQSKQSLAAEKPAQSGRSAVSINDIVEPLTVEPTSKSLKRKADDISDVLEEEVRVWASKDSSISTPEVDVSSDVEMSPSEPIQAESSPAAEAISPPKLVETALAEPAHKKLRKFAEVVGYAALGGVAIFSTLVATAPDFL